MVYCKDAKRWLFKTANVVKSQHSDWSDYSCLEEAMLLCAGRQGHLEDAWQLDHLHTEYQKFLNQSLTPPFKFRAWDKGASKMIVTGFHVFGEYTLFNGIGAYLLENNLDKTSLERYNDVVVMQFTGLKDKNGKEIYERDIVKYYSGSVALVEWDETGGWVCSKDANRFRKKWRFPNELIEVIGNIYETPELLTHSLWNKGK